MFPLYNMIAAAVFTCATVLTITTNVADSKFLYRPEINGWIKPYKLIATWEEASQRCRAAGAVMASPITDELLAEMRTIISSQTHDNSYYMGTMARIFPEHFVSEEGVKLDDMAEIDIMGRLDPHDGQCLSMSSEAVRVVPCSLKLPYMCYKKLEPDMKLTECGTFDKGYKLERTTGSCYKYHSELRSWDEAYSICASEGAYLTIINDQREAQLLSGKVVDKYFNPFVGLRDLKENGTWTSIHGEAVEKLHNVWVENHVPGRNCCYMNASSGKLHDYYCKDHSTFFCEKNPESVRFSMKPRHEGDVTIVSRA